jgi:uncharacterized membrane protein YfcA
LHLSEAIFLFFAAVIGGVMNSVAGGGSFIAFPALLFSGVPPIQANATNTVALWSGIVASGGAYRRRLNVARRVFLPLFIASLAGGLLGAVLLLKTPQRTFLRLLPWLLLAATLLFVFGNRLRVRSGMAHDASWRALAVACLFQLIVATYGGYFGGGMGIMMLGMLAALGMGDIHEMNALKTVLGSVVNGVAVVTFIVAGAVVWREGAVMVAGAITGGWFGAHYAQKIEPRKVRWVVIAIGVAMTVYFFVRPK